MFHSYFNDNNINHVHLCDGIYAEKLNWPCLDHIESCCFVNTIFASMQLADHQHQQHFGWSSIQHNHIHCQRLSSIESF
jgi:hypothetical protein